MKRVSFQKPWWLALAALILCILVMAGGYAMQAFGLLELSERYAWTVAGTFVLCFAIFNTVLYLNSAPADPYWTGSVVSFVLLLFASAGAAQLFSGLSLREAGSYRWIFMVLTFGYLVLISIVQFMRKIVEMAKREDRRKFD